MTVTDLPPHEHDTRRRLLEAACGVFAEQGFRSATIRDICQRAGANVAAVNYHFGDKATLYRAVLESSLGAALAQYPPDLGLPANPTPEDRLRAFVRSFLLRILSADKPEAMLRMMTREMVEPTGALEHVCQRVHLPLLQRLRGIVDEIAGGALDEAGAMACVHSIVAQCVFYRHAAPVLSALNHPIPSDAAAIERLAEHVHAFSLAGIRARAQAARGGHP